MKKLDTETPEQKAKKERLQKVAPAVLLGVLVVAAAGCVVYATLNRTYDYRVDTGVSSTKLTGDGTTIVLADGENLISAGGVYHLTGTADGSVHVKANDTDEVKLILDNVNLTNAAGPAIYVETNGNVYVELVGDSVIDSAPTSELNGAIFSKADLAFSAETDEAATLTITSTIDGIVSKDDLEMNGGKYIIEADDDGIVGKDSLKITAGEYDVVASGLGLKTSNTEKKGDLEITGGDLKIQSGGKGIKAEGSLKLTAGTYHVDSMDDALHSNGFIYITGGDYVIASGDDGVHADTVLTVEGGNLDIVKSHEGLEANIMNLVAGTIAVVADDDGINTTNSSGENQAFRAGDAELNISGGMITVNSQGDGLDSNGSITISGGQIYVNGPTSSADAAVDCDGAITITGGLLVAVGSSGMAQNATSATQPSVLINLSSSYTGDLKFGDVTFSPEKSYNSVLVSSPSLEVGQTYELTIEGEAVSSVTIAENITSSGTGGGMMPGGAPGGKGGNGGGTSGGGRRF